MVKQQGSENDAYEQTESGIAPNGKKHRKGQYLPTGKTLKPRQNERDSMTRGDDRRHVTMEPAVKSIINVYQLIQKEKLRKGATPVYTTLGRAKSAVVGGIRSGSSGSGQKEVASKSKRNTVPGFEQYMVRPDGSLDLTPEQKRGLSDKDYTKLNNAYREKKDEIIAKQRSEEEAASIAAIKTSLESRTAFKSDSPKNILIRRMKELKIPLTTEAKIDNDSRYSGRDLTDEGIVEINRAFDVAIAEGRMSESPPPFIALTTRTNSPAQTHTVYIKNDLSFRRRKTTHTKVKRPIRGNKRKMPLAKGSKKRVVMKKKGGRR